MKWHTHTNQSGFSLLEMLVAVFIFSMALVGFMLIAQRGIQTTRNAANRTIAQFLAQEESSLLRRSVTITFYALGFRSQDRGI